MLQHAITFMIYLAGLIFLGRLVLGMIAPPRRSQNMATWLPTAFMLGTGTVCVMALPLSILNIKTAPWMLLIVSALVTGAGAFFRKKPEDAASSPWTAHEFAALAVFAMLLTANFLLTSAYPQFDIDMVGHILMKARAVADTSYAGAIYFHDPVFATAHNNYPPLTVFLHSFMATLGLDTVADYHALNYIILFLIGLALHTALRSRIGILAGLGWSFVLISTADYLRSQFLISSTDIFLALAILLTALAFLDTKPDPRAGKNILFAVLCAFTLLIKNDAIVFIGLLTLGLWIMRRHFPIRHLLIMGILAGPWMLYRLTLPDPDAGAEFMLKHLGAYLLPATLPALGRSVFSVLTHNLNWIFLIGLCTWPLLWRQKDIRILMACVMLTLASYIILVWGAIPISVHDETLGLMRLFSQFYPLALFITALSLHKFSEPHPH